MPRRQPRSARVSSTSRRISRTRTRRRPAPAWCSPSSGEILTNNHVIRGRDDDPRHRPEHGPQLRGDRRRLQRRGRRRGAAARAAPRISIRSCAATRRTLRVGQRVTAVGNAGGTAAACNRDREGGGRGRTITASDGDGRLRAARRADRDERAAPARRLRRAAPERRRPRDRHGHRRVSVGFELQSANEAYAIPINRALAIAKQIEAGTRPRPSTSAATAVPRRQRRSAPPAARPARSSPGRSAARPPTAPASSRATRSRRRRPDGRTYDALGPLLLQHAAGDTVTLDWLDQTGAAQTASIQTAAGPPQ